MLPEHPLDPRGIVGSDQRECVGCTKGMGVNLREIEPLLIERFEHGCQTAGTIFKTNGYSFPDPGGKVECQKLVSRFLGVVNDHVERAASAFTKDRQEMDIDAGTGKRLGHDKQPTRLILQVNNELGNGHAPQYTMKNRLCNAT
jgi:hypothetical protein